MRLFTKHAEFPEISEPARQVIQEQLALVFAPDEQSFTRRLLARLLAEGCNLPMRIAKPRFYDLMLRGVLPTLPIRFQREFSKYVEPASCYQYPQFVEAMGFYRIHAPHAEQIIALVATHSIEHLVQQVWQFQLSDFQKGVEQFEAHIWVQMLHLLPEEYNESDMIPAALARRRLSIALATSLARYLPDRQAFQITFGSLAELMQSMSHDHTVFCRFMAFCHEHVPYCSHVASQIMWRTLETLQLEVYPQPSDGRAES